MKNVLRVLLLAAMAVVYPQASFAKNVHIVDEDPASGFRVVRMGKSDAAVLDDLCKHGKVNVIVLSGDGSHEEAFARDRCPGMKVIYNVQQRTKTPLTRGFLKFFDQEVAKAKAEGYQIMFRCKCGCHRTGRLAAYYNMKYKGMSAGAALKDLGKNMTFGAKFLFRRTLKKQVNNFVPWIQRESCGERKAKKARKWCVQKKDSLV